MLYFDHCATTPPYPEVVKSISEVLLNHYGNPSSIHHLGVEAAQLLQKSREVIAAALQIKVEEIVFTSGGTESNNLAIKGVAMQYQQRGRHLITTKIEHPSVSRAFAQLEQLGFEVTYLSPGTDGAVRVQDVMEAVRPDTILVSVMHVNNETGAIQPIARIGQFLRNYPRILFHVDAVQSVGKLPIFPADWGIDLFSVSAHKIGGPKGTGLLYIRPGVTLHPLLAGGGQEEGLRSGTENVAGIVGMAKAVRMTLGSREVNTAHLYRLRAALLQRLLEIEGIRYNGATDPAQMAPHVINISVPGLKPEIVVHALEKFNIYISTRSACSSKSDDLNQVLLAMGLPREHCISSLRISLSAEQQMKDADRLVAGLKHVINELTV
jgi:cysteine desulfurase